MSFKIIKVGRAKDNDIVLTHSSVSRYHCELFYDGNGNVFLTDKNSANGTFVNGRQIFTSVQLQSNDIVKPGIDVPLAWKNYNSNQQTSKTQANQSEGTEANEPVYSPNEYTTPKKINRISKTVLFVFAVLAVSALGGLWYVINEYYIGDKKLAPNDIDKSNKKSDQPNKIEKKKEITYDFSCLTDSNDLGTTGIIDVLEKVDSKVTNTLGGDVTIEEEKQVGDQLLSDCRNEFNFIQKDSKIKNLEDILKRLTDQIKKPKGLNYQIFLIESDELNAFTAGAKIFVTTKMYSFCKTNDELACVIGHEINHNELGHIKEILQKERLLSADGAAFAQIATISFGQKKETHCDMTGIDLAIAAGYNGCVNIELWTRMQEQFEEDKYNVLDNLMRSHPYSEKRAKCSRQHILMNYNFDCESRKK
jgi:pSer/pThr/pTyr-binding forkhead associated (FHA) protein